MLIYMYGQTINKRGVNIIDDKRKDKRIEIRTSKSMYEEIDQITKELGMTKTQFIIESITNYKKLKERIINERNR